MHSYSIDWAPRARWRAPSAVAALLGLALIALDADAQRPERLADWTRPLFPVAEYAARRASALALLGRDDILLVPSAEGTSGGETFRQLDDFEYFVGLEVPRSVLVIDGGSRRAMLYVPRTDPRFENAGRPNDFPGRELLDDPSVRALSGVDTVLAYDGFEQFLSTVTARRARLLVNTGRPGIVVERASTPFTAPTPGELFIAHVLRNHAGAQIGNAYTVIAGLRMIKSSREIERLREAARITSVAIARGAARVRPGVDERTLTGAFTADCMALGAQRDAFSPIIKSGPNSLWPWRILGAHYDRRNRTLRSGDLVIFDVGCERDHYVSDVGRTFPVDDRFTPRQRELVEMVRRVSDAVIAAARPGITLAALQAVAAGMIPPSARKYMQAPLYFGHHLGLSTADPALTDAALAPGMVFTIEPWYYDHDEGVAVFIEDEVLITATGSENLTAGLPRDATGLEALRRGSALTATRPDSGPGPSPVGVPPIGLLGSFADDYGNSFRISAALFEQLPRGRFHVVEWNVSAQYLVAHNDNANPSDAGLWTRIDWMPFDGMAPYVWGFCLTAYRAVSEAAARATVSADRAAPRVGCNGFPFSRLKPAP